MEDFVEQISADRPGSASVQRSAMLEVRLKIFHFTSYKKGNEKRDFFCLV